MPYAKRDDLSLYYEQAGRGDPPLVFVHGWCCDHSFFEPQFEHFQSSHSVTTFDLRGCGRSDRLEEGYDLPSLADDLAWLCAEIGISRPVVIGHSLGAMIAIELAARHPSLPSAIIADDPGPINPPPEVRNIYEGFAMELGGPDGEAVRRAWVEDGVGPTADSEQRDRIVETMCSVPLSVAAAGIRGLVAWNGVCRAGVVHGAAACVELGALREQRSSTPTSVQASHRFRHDRRRWPLSSARGT